MQQPPYGYQEPFQAAQKKKMAAGLVVALTLAGVLVLGVAAFGVLVWLGGRREDPLRAEELSTQADLPSGELSPQAQRLAAANAAWQQFDRLSGATFRTEAMLTSHLLLANQTAANLPDSEANEIMAHNAIQFRKRLPDVMIAGEHGVAIGDDATILVPSNDAKRCKELAESWSKGAMRRSLTEAGYVEIVCVVDNGRKGWTLRSK